MNIQFCGLARLLISLVMVGALTACASYQTSVSGKEMVTWMQEVKTADCKTLKHRRDSLDAITGGETMKVQSNSRAGMALLYLLPELKKSLRAEYKQRCASDWEKLFS